MNGMPLILPGDHLLYGKRSPFDLSNTIVCIKTWSAACHIEICVEPGKVVASRNGIGVNLYDIRKENLIYVLRPRFRMDLDRGMHWFNKHAKGQGYDWMGLLNFDYYLFGQHHSKTKMFCSCFAARFDRHCKLFSFATHFDADCIAPADFLMSPVFYVAFSKDGSRKIA